MEARQVARWLDGRVEVARSMERLELAAPELFAELCDAPASEQRAASIHACRLAVAATGLDHPVVTRALDSLTEGRTSRPDERSDLADLADELNALASRFMEQSRGSDEARTQYLARFSRARAAAAVAFALEGEAPRASAEAIYEAAHAIDEPGEMFEGIRAEMCAQRARSQHG